jgi:hypothetical protein
MLMRLFQGCRSVAPNTLLPIMVIPLLPAEAFHARFPHHS